MIEGDVSVQRGDSQDWVTVSVNAPLLTKDRLATAPSARAELQFDRAHVLRIAGGADLAISQLEAGRWYPGLIGVPHCWAPGIAAFFGFGGGGGIGFRFSNVGWAPLASCEVIHPWWGRSFPAGGPW